MDTAVLTVAVPYADMRTSLQPWFKVYPGRLDTILECLPKHLKNKSEVGAWDFAHAVWKTISKNKGMPAKPTDAKYTCKIVIMALVNDMAACNHACNAIDRFEI